MTYEGKKIREFRESKKLTQAQLGKMLGVSQALIGQWETGKRKPKYETLEKIASVLGVSVLEIMEIDELDFESRFNANYNNLLEKTLHGDGDISNLIGMAKAFDDANQTRLNAAFDQLNEPGQEKAVERVEELTEIPKYQRTPDQEEE